MTPPPLSPLGSIFRYFGPILAVLVAEVHSADMRAGKFLLVTMGGRAEGLACADPGARTPIGASGNFDKNSCCVAPPLAWSTYVANRDSALPKNNSIHPVFLKVILNAILHGAQLSSVFLIDFWGNVGTFK